MNKDLFPNKTLAGSSMQHVAEDCENARITLQAALGRVRAACPHPRDYINNDALYQQALAHHYTHINQLNTMIDFYSEKTIHCVEQA